MAIQFFESYKVRNAAQKDIIVRENFAHTDLKNPHVDRGRTLLKKYPELRKLMGAYRPSALWITGLVSLQLLVAGLLSEQHWAWVVATSWLVGALVSHALFVFVHEACHNLVMKSTWANQLYGILANIGQGFPSSVGFRHFHLLHHSNMGEYEYDADLAFHKEAQWVKNIWWRKIVWYLGFVIVETLRPLKLKAPKMNLKWVALNFLLVIASNALIWFFLGPKGLAYILLSTFFGVGLHPVGARWVQEHYTFEEGQETYSYYGPLNTVSFNVGYHNEHHDLYRVPWVHLPKIKRKAPEFYDNLYAHTSWTKLLLRFIFDPKVDLYARITRQRSSLTQ